MQKFGGDGLQTKEPWTHLCHQKYANGWAKSSLIHWDQNNPSSPIWQVVNANKHMFKDYSFWEVGNGEEAEFLRDSWQQIPKLQEEIEMPELQANLVRNGVLKIKDFWSSNADSSPFQQWKMEEWFKASSPREEIHNLIQLLKERKIEIREGPDQIRWAFKAPGQFNFKEAVELASRTGMLPTKKKWCSIWNLNHWPKITLFLWLLLRGRILTWENLKRHGMVGPSRCVLCQQGKKHPNICYRIVSGQQKYGTRGKQL